MPPRPWRGVNYLAHAWLAGGDAHLEVGGVLGDFVRGRPDPALAPGLRDGIVLHRRIDRFTDAHPHVAAARALFPPPWRRYAGILLDVWFDHCLARDFARHTGLALAPFSRRLRRHLRHAWPQLPPRLQHFVQYMEAHDLPAAYAERDMLERVLEGLSRRLRRSNPLAAALPQLESRERPLAVHFEAFIPELAAFAAEQRQRLGGG